MACKPWTGAIKEPTEDSGPIINEASPPDESYAFDFVHGYKSDECYQNCLYNAEGKPTY